MMTQTHSGFMQSSAVKKAPIIFGIVNITPDSFSDGGRFLEPGAAIHHAHRLIQDGAQILDLGAASSHPDAKKITVEEELRRLKPVLQALLKENLDLSVDSCQPEVQRYALRQGVSCLNDISGFPDSSLYPELADSGCRLILMHSIQRGAATRRFTEPRQVYEQIVEFFEIRLEKLIQNGIDKKRLILDPGMGFFLGANPQSSVHVLARLDELKKHFGLSVMVSVSRKSFLGSLSRRPVADRGAVSLAAELFAWRKGADYIRTHDAAPLRDACRIWAALKQSEKENLL